MRNILHDLYYGKIIPHERRAPRREKRLGIARKIEEEEQYFMGKLSPEDCQRFQDLSNLHLQLFSTEEEDLFSYGFTLGMLLTFDVMDEAALIVPAGN